MTIEEYLEERFKGNTDMYAYHVCKKAIEMARQEERVMKKLEEMQTNIQAAMQGLQGE